mgnify:CR=1 FL=1
MKRYNEYESVEELYEAYNIKPHSKFLTEAENKKSAGYEKEKKKVQNKTDKEVEDPDKVAKQDKLEVVYAEPTKKYNNIFKHIIVFTNDRDTKNNKTLKNIEDAVANIIIENRNMSIDKINVTAEDGKVFCSMA